MRRRTFLLKASPAAVGLALAQLGSTNPEQLIGTLKSEIPRMMESTQVPGLSIAVIHDARILWRQGFGLKLAGTNQHVDNDTIFGVGSVSKTVFAYAVMKLCERNTLNLDTPLTRYTPVRIIENDPRLDLITARHVLSHTSGLQNWRSEKEPLKIHFTPGEQYLYSGEGYDYLQSVVTQLTGHVDPTRCSTFEAGLKVCATDFDSYMHANLLAPFGMTSSGYVFTDKFERHAAAPHDANEKALPQQRATDVEVARYGAAGMLYTTATDYAKFLIEIMAPKPSDHFRLRKDSIVEMVRPQIKGGDSPQSWRALGWEVVRSEKDDFIVHGGDNSGFHAFAAASLKRRNGYIFMTNGDGGTDLLKKLIIGDTPLNQLLAA
jgi:CubicO group peptidase (beta-lactamase class C family)